MQVKDWITVWEDERCYEEFGNDNGSKYNDRDIGDENNDVEDYYDWENNVYVHMKRGKHIP